MFRLRRNIQENSQIFPRNSNKMLYHGVNIFFTGKLRGVKSHDSVEQGTFGFGKACGCRFNYGKHSLRKRTTKSYILKF